MPRGTPSREVSPFAAHPHLTARDRDLLALLEDHQVLSSDQLHRLFFGALRTCQLRLEVLRGLDLVDRFRYSRRGGGTEQWKWVLGWRGARFQAAAADRPAPTERAHREHMLRLSARPDLPHLLATNEVFVRLHHHARTAPVTAPPAELLRWWPERTATARFAGIRPDGHGIWAHTRHRDGVEQTVGFWLECDTGTEALGRLIAKLDGYARLAGSGGPRYPVLFWLPSTRREDNLQRILRERPPPRTIPVATATHDSHPAEAVWLPVNRFERLCLEDLPSSHGQQSASNPNWRDGHLDLTDQRHHRSS